MAQSDSFDDAPADAEDKSAAVLAMQPPATPTQKASPEQIAQANAALSAALSAYHRGDYGQAEQALKQALVLQPFLAAAHLALGKIYLLRGIAADDHKRLLKGRRMLEMALKIDPNMADAAVFLDMFP